jgi:multiple sugar transport system ATP-binding protein
MSEVVLHNLTKRYGDVCAVDDVDLHVRDRELLVLVGPSGCGKTTTLRMIAGLDDVSSGEICIGSRVVNQVAPKDRNVAMVFQDHALYPHMNVYQNMAFGLKMRRCSRQDIDRRVQQAAGILGIEPLLRRRPAELSGGQRQRVAVGRAIVRNPSVFLLDEPLCNLDARLRVVMRTELVKLQKELQATMIHVTHDQDEAMMMGDRVAVMRAGRIQQVGAPMEVYRAPANRFVAEFIGSPPMRFLDGTLAMHDDCPRVEAEEFFVVLPPQRRQRYGPWSGRKVTLGIRAESLVEKATDGSAGPWSAITARIVVVQPLGAETILEVQCGNAELAARVDSGRSYTAGDEVPLYINGEQCQLFDPDSGNVL